MWWPISRWLICPAHERLLGRPTFKFLRELEASQWWSPDALRALQMCKLRALLEHARSHTAYWQDRLADLPLDDPQADPFAMLGSLPLLSKDEVRAHLPEMVWRDAPGGVFKFNTGGSSGEPLIFYFDRRRQGYDDAARIRTHRWFGVDIGQREFYLWGSPIELSTTDRIKAWRDRLFNHRLVNAFAMSPARMEAYFDEFERFAPRCLFGYPSSIALWVQHARKIGRRLRTDSLRAVFVTGEACDPPDRAAIEAYFGVPVADGYGSRDGGFIAHECPQGSRHVMART
jgi:phenylacetate-CoA ligase